MVTFYRQIFGLPMGSPACPIFADLVLKLLEDEVSKQLGFGFSFFWRYVYHILTAVSADKIEEIEAVFNSYNKHIQFTVDQEINERISFLKVICILEGRSIKTDWFHNKTHGLAGI